MKAIQTFRRIALLAVLAVAALSFASAANALPIDPGDGGGDPPLPPPKPNLVIGQASVTHGTTVNDWVISYTVANRGNADAGAFRVSVGQDGVGPIKDTAYSSLAAGASRSETIHLLRTNCYIAVRFTADAGRVVSESNETDNVREAVDLTSLTCPTQPKYKVKAVSFHANDETGIDLVGSDEPYWVLCGVGLDGTQHCSASHVFGDIDTGDTASFGPTEGCMYISCAGGAAPLGMGFSVQAWESDEADVPDTLNSTSIAFHDIGGFIVGQGDPMLARKRAEQDRRRHRLDQVVHLGRRPRRDADLHAQPDVPRVEASRGRRELPRHAHLQRRRGRVHDDDAGDSGRLIRDRSARREGRPGGRPSSCSAGDGRAHAPRA